MLKKIGCRQTNTWEGRREKGREGKRRRANEQRCGWLPRHDAGCDAIRSDLM